MHVEFRGATFLNLDYQKTWELFSNIGFHKDYTSVFVASDHFKRVNFNARFGFGQGVNYSPADGLEAFLASTQNGQFSIALRPNKRLRIQETYYYTRLARTFTNHIIRQQVNYQFTPAWSLRAIVDYNAVLTNPTAVSFDQSKAFTGDALISYIPHPGTAIYMGYTNRRENLALIGSNDTAQTARTLNPDLQTGSQLFVKVSYLFRF
jgi:hypothetical protein